MQDIRDAVRSLRGETERFLCDLMRFPSMPGHERDAMEYVAGRFAALGSVERIPLSNSLRQDEDYADPIPGLDYEGRFNLRVRVEGAGDGPALLFNTHIDVVPPSQGQERPFEPRVAEGVVHGRGACDAKGQAAALFTALLAMQRMGLKPRGDV